ncbi:hypothetical protein, partial [Streptomyces sp. NPDC048277]|uniref:hypothetical protein n=1 Tax=Streptomyces sp. NPDC048277 TaxID=3155027 RepID=UPI0033F7B3FB
MLNLQLLLAVTVEVVGAVYRRPPRLSAPVAVAEEATGRGRRPERMVFPYDGGMTTASPLHPKDRLLRTAS